MSGSLVTRFRRAWDAFRGDPYDVRWMHKRSSMTRALNTIELVVAPRYIAEEYPGLRRWLERDSQIPSKKISEEMREDIEEGKP